MSTDFRALLAEMAAELDHKRQCLMDDRSLTHPLADRARAVLARWGRPTPPAPPAEGEIDQLVSQLRDYAQGEQENGWHDDAARFRRAAELLERHPAPVPVPVSDRPWERKGWCDDRGRCWFGREESDDWSADWTLATQEFCTYAPRTVCLPAHALPLPAPHGGEVEP